MTKNYLKGFTLIELVVTMVIFTILTTLTFSSYPQFNLAISLNESARDLYSSIKSAQISGSSRGGSYSGDGIYFNLTSPLTFVAFSDSNRTDPNSLGLYKGDSIYIGTDDALSREKQILNGVRINDLCILIGTGPRDCSSDSLSISFNRPSTRANIFNYILDINNKVVFADKAYIEITRDLASSPYKCIIIYKFGQIELKDGGCSLY